MAINFFRRNKGGTPQGETRTITQQEPQAPAERKIYQDHQVNKHLETLRSIGSRTENLPTSDKHNWHQSEQNPESTYNIHKDRLNSLVDTAKSAVREGRWDEADSHFSDISQHIHAGRGQNDWAKTYGHGSTGNTRQTHEEISNALDSARHEMGFARKMSGEEPKPASTGDNGWGRYTDKPIQQDAWSAQHNSW